MSEPPVGHDGGLPVQVLHEGQWVPGWRFDTRPGEVYAFWQAEPGTPTHGWLPADRVRLDPKRGWLPVRSLLAARRTL